MQLVELAFGEQVAKAFATRTENSSPGASITRRSPVGPGQRGTLNARSGHFAGKTRGVGRHESRDANSSPSVTRVQPRSPQGKFVSHESDLKIIHPSGRVSRQPKSSALGIYRKGRGAETRGHVEKKHEYSASGAKQIQTGRGFGSQATGVARNSGPYGRGNTRFGGTGTRGKRLR